MNHLGSHAILNEKIDRGKTLSIRLTGKEQHWFRFRSLKNEVTTLIRESKTNHVNKIAASLQSGNLTSAIGGKLKSFMSRASSSTIPPLNDSISDSFKAHECDKANLRNFFFTRQALVDGSQNNLPANNQMSTGIPLSFITIMQAEVLDV